MSLLGRWSDWPLTRKSVLVVAGPLLLLLVSVLAIYRLERQTAQAEEDVRRTLEIISDLHEAHSLLAETAAGVRGYVLVREENFLDPYYDAEPRLMGVVKGLAQRAADGSRAARFAALPPLFDLKLSGWRRLLESHAEQSPEWVEARLIEGKQILDVLRKELRVLGEQERSELAARSEIAASLRQRNLAVTLVFALAGGLGAVLASALFAGGLTRRLRLLAADADRLGSGALQLEGADGADEVGQVRSRLREAGQLLRARARQLDEARREAEAANSAKTEFLSRMSHELRTPLNAILGYAQLLGEDLGDPRTQRFAGHVEVAGRHLLGLITEMLDVAGIESGSVTVETRRVALANALAEALDLIRPQAEAAGISLAALPEVDHAHVLADPGRLRQVLLNLLGNAIKFNRSGGRVALDVQRHGEDIEIGVRDEGRGLNAEAVARLFRPFERIEATARGVEGTGLGLALSKRLLQAMGGSIGVDSQQALGSRFWLRLPAEPPEHLRLAASAAAEPVDARTDAAEADAARPEAAGPRRLLLVEDNASNRALLTTLMERRPQWQLQHAASLAEARAALAVSQFDALLLDLRLPDGDGGDLLAELRAQGRALPPVLVLSADASEASRQRLQALGSVAYLTKPLDVRQFFQEIDRCLA